MDDKTTNRPEIVYRHAVLDLNETNVSLAKFLLVKKIISFHNNIKLLDTTNPFEKEVLKSVYNMLITLLEKYNPDYFKPIIDLCKIQNPPTDIILYTIVNLLNTMSEKDFYFLNNLF